MTLIERILVMLLFGMILLTLDNHDKRIKYSQDSHCNNYQNKYLKI